MHSFYSEELIEEIRLNNDIVDVVSEYVKLDKKGKDYFGLCPFHKEKTPSFSVAPGKQIFYCFGCGKGGNVFQFIMNVENLDYIEAVRFLAERARILLPEGGDTDELEKANLREELIKLNTEAARFYFSYLNTGNSEKANEYLKKRNLTEHIIRKFGIGYSPEEWDALYKHLLKNGFNEKTILKSGLIIPNKKGGYFDRFRGRIIFPIFNVRGNVIGFGGRVLDSSLPKYMNSPETPVYNKGRNLYALNFAKNSGEKKIIMVEGYMDVISLYQCGIINTVASLGTALTENQGRLLKKYAEEIIISYDADTAGQAATMRGLDILNDIGCNVKVLSIPGSKDPDEFVQKNGASAFRKLVDNAVTLVEYKIMALKNQIDMDSTEGKIKFLNKMADLLVKIDNNVEREMYIKKLAREYEIREESLYAEVLKKSKPKTGFKSAVLDLKGKAVRHDADKPGDIDENEIHYERLLISLICNDNSVYRMIRDKVGISDFSSEESRKIAKIVFERIENSKGIVTGELLNIVDKTEADEYARIIQQECNCDDNYKAVLDIIKKITLYKLNKRQEEIFKILNDKSVQTEGVVEELKLELQDIVMKKKKM